MDERGLSRECSLDAVAARNVLKVALASKIVLEEALAERTAAIAEECDYEAMSEMNDECLSSMRGIPTAAMTDSKLGRIIDCAESGECTLEEIADMIDELERLNQECEVSLSRECSLDAVQARNILKVALGTQAVMARQRMDTK